MSRVLSLLCGLAVIAGMSPAQWQRFGQAATGDGKLPAAKASSLAQEMVSAHNIVRARVGTAPLTWSDRLAGIAQTWADRLQASGQFAHSPNNDLGENLFEIAGAPATPSRVVNDWAGESRDYDYGSNTCRAVCGHYTQIVWNETKEVGCAVARGGGREVWVCNYDPPGNWAGKKPY
jgi:uncharacterized protein YkwD